MKKYAGQCVHRWVLADPLALGGARGEICVECAATCTRDRTGQVVDYDAHVPVVKDTRGDKTGEFRRPKTGERT